MQFDYYSGRQAEQFAFIQIPKVLIADERFQDLALDAKLLYSIMLDRAALSSKNGWLDDRGRVYIIYTLEQIMADLHCANQKVSRMMKELEKIGLIERKRQGQGKPTLIYVKDFATGMESEFPKASDPSQVKTHENHDSGVDNFSDECKSQVLSHENHDSGVVNTMIPDSWKSCTNKTDINKTEINKTNPINLSVTEYSSEAEQAAARKDDGWDVMRLRNEYLEYFKDKFDYEGLMMKFPYDHGRIDEILETMVDIICSKAKTVRINGEEKPIEVVKSQFMKLDEAHIEYIMDCFHDQTSDIRNIRQYMLTTLYNAPLTIDHYYTAKVRHDMANWQGDE